MTIRAGKINGKNLNYIDQDNSALDYVLVNSGIIEGMQVTAGQVSIGRAILITKRTSVTPNQKFGMHLEITANETIDTTGTKKVWIAVDPQYINDGTLATNPMGTQLASVQVGANYPSDDSYYIPLASIASGVITDERVMISGKPILQEGFPLNKTKRIDPATGNEVLRDVSSGSTVPDTFISEYIDPTTGDILRVPFSGIKNQLSSAGKYVQTVQLGEAISAGIPTAIAIVGTINYYIALTAATGSAVKKGVRINVKKGVSIRNVSTFKNSSSSSATFQLRDDSDTFIKEVSVASGTNTADMNYTPSADGILRIVMNDSANFNSSNDYVAVATAQSKCPYIVSGTSNNVTDGTNALGFSMIVYNFGLKGYKARADKLIESNFANVSGFVVGPKSYGDTVDLDGNNNSLISGFSGLAGTYYLSNTPGVISTTKGTIETIVGYSGMPTALILSTLYGTEIGVNVIAVSASTPQYSVPSYGTQTDITYTKPVCILGPCYLIDAVVGEIAFGTPQDQQVVLSIQESYDDGATWNTTGAKGKNIFRKKGILIRGKIDTTMRMNYNNGYPSNMGPYTVTFNVTS